MKKSRLVNRAISSVLTLALVGAFLPNLSQFITKAAPATIANDSLSAVIGDLGQIETLNIKNNRSNTNFVLPNNTSPQNGVQHQWMGEMIFSYRTNETGIFPDNRVGFVEVDTNKTLAAGGSTTYSNATANLAANPYIRKTTVSDKKVEINFLGQDETSSTARTMKGFDVKSAFNMETNDGSLEWEITLSNKGTKYIEFGDVGLPMPWNNKYANVSDTYNNRLTVHNFAGADSGYAYAIRTSGEGNYMMFTPVPETGAKIEYVDYWMGSVNGVSGERAGSLYSNWTSDSGGWFPGLNVYYIHSKDIRKTGRSYFEDSSSLVLAPGENKTYKFKFSAVRAGDNTPGESASSYNNSSNSMEEREANMRSILYNSGMVDVIAYPGFQTSINMPTKIALHYNEALISDVKLDIQCVHENDPYDSAHIPVSTPGLVNNKRTGRGLHDGNPDYEESYKYVEKKIVDGEEYHIYELNFGCIGNTSVRVDYKLKTGETKVEKFTQYEFNVLAELDEVIETHSEFMVTNQQDTNPASPTYGIYNDWYFSSGADANMKNHWGDDWGHDNINFITMKNFLNPDPDEIKSIELYLIDFMWESYMKNTQSKYHVANYLSASGIYSDSTSPYSRTYSEMMEATAYFNMYRIQKTYPELIKYRETAQFYLDKAYGIYYNRVGSGTIGFYGEQQVPDMIEALREEGMTTQAQNLQTKFALTKGRAMANAQYPYGSEFEYDNTGEEGAYSASKALRKYYPTNDRAALALTKMEMADWKTRAMRGLQPTWFHYGVPVFRGGEGWWNFQYTASLAGYIMDDWLRYQNNNWDIDQSAWAQRTNYAGKISNFNAVNMGQISDKYVGNVSWRFSMYKGGVGAQNVNDGGSRVMNNGWNDFSGESDEGIYGSLLTISNDIVIDPIIGLFGYGCEVEEENKIYTVIPKDGIGKRFNFLNEKLYLSLEQDSASKVEVSTDRTYMNITLDESTLSEHLLRIALDGAGLADGYYTVKVDDEVSGQFFVKDNSGVISVVIPEKSGSVVTVEKVDDGENKAPEVSISVQDEDDLQAVVSFALNGIAVDDGAPSGLLTYKWEVLSAPEGGVLTFSNNTAPAPNAIASKAGAYVIKLTVSDGELSGSAEITLNIAPPPERLAPVIGSVTAKQDPVNISVITLSGSATSDPLYNSPVSYKWELISAPEGATAIIGGVANATAYMKVDKAGSYTVRFTAIDEDKSAFIDVTVNALGAVDGVERAISVVTKIGQAPTLPQKADVIMSDGTFSSQSVQWNAIDPASYSKEDTFEVEGTVVGSGAPIKVTVYVVKNDAINAALSATPTAIINSVNDLGGVTKLNDGIDPKSSSDTSNGVWHNWRGDQGGPAWVQYVWTEAFLVTSMDVYVFRDGGGNFQPKDMTITLRDQNGNWYTPRAVQGLGNSLNTYNRTTFESAYITGIRIDMKPSTLGCGIIEWKVNGHVPGEYADKAKLKELLSIAEGYKTSLFTEGFANLSTEIASAKLVSANLKATQEEIDSAVKKLINAIAKLKPLNNNVAFAAAASASYTSSWETITAVNDNNIASGATHYGSWGNTSAFETVTYTWPTGAEISSTNLYIWSDGGGIKAPSAVKYEYMDINGVWRATPNPQGLGIKANEYNLTTFDTFEAKALRVTLTKVANDNEGVGLTEWVVTGKILNWGDDEAVVDKSELEAAIIAAEGKVESNYTVGSWAVLAQKLSQAKDVFNNTAAVQEDVNFAASELLNAIDSLVLYIPVENIKINSSAITVLSLGATVKLTVTITPTNATYQNVAWTSSNSKVLAVQNDGTLTAVSKGMVTLTATLEGKVHTIIVRIS